MGESFFDTPQSTRADLEQSKTVADWNHVPATDLFPGYAGDFGSIHIFHKLGHHVRISVSQLKH